MNKKTSFSKSELATVLVFAGFRSLKPLYLIILIYIYRDIGYAVHVFRRYFLYVSTDIRFWIFSNLKRAARKNSTAQSAIR